MKLRWIAWMTALIAAIALIGCGGGGGGGGGVAQGSARFFATDNLSNDYDQVWVNILKLELVPSTGAPVTVFNDAAGRTIDLRKLNDGGLNQYAFLGIDSAPQGTYTGMRITLDRGVNLLPTGGSTLQSRLFDDEYGTPNTVLTFNFPSAITLGGSAVDVIIDFDLSQWTINGSGEVDNCVVVKGSGNGFSNSSNHENDDYEGTVSGLTGTAPNQTFTLSLPAGVKMTVTTNSFTSIFNNNGQPNPVLANGKRVEVRGAFDPGANSFNATVVKIKSSSSDDDDYEVKGPPSSPNQGARTFVIQAREVEGFLPTNLNVTVQINDTTQFFTDRGLPMTEVQFYMLFAGDGSALQVEAEGSVYNSGTNTLTARKVKIDDDSLKGGGEIEATGTASAINLGAGTFTLTLTSWEGFSSSVGTPFTAATSGGTEFKDVNGSTVSKATFFELLATATAVKVEGWIDGNVINVSEAKIRTSSGGGGGGNDPHEIEGTVSNINAGAKTFTVSIVDWFGFNGTPGQLINVTMSSTATYRNDEGDSITVEQFFAGLSNGGLVEVDGTVSGNAMTGVKAKLDDD